MGDREAKVVYRTRTLDKGEPRPRIPTALDPYDNPYIAERPKRRELGARDSNSTLDGDGSTTEVARSTTRTAYVVREDDRSGDNYVDSRRSTKAQPPTSDHVPTRRSVVVDQTRDDPRPPRRLDPAPDSRAVYERGYINADYERSRERGREYYMEDRSRPSGSPYVIEARGEIIDISVPGRDRDRAYDRDATRYAYDDSRQSRRKLYDREYAREPTVRRDGNARSSNTVLIEKDDSPRPSRYEYEEYRPPRSSAREYEYDREDDWRLVDSMRDTRIGSTQPPSTYTERQGRSRAATQSSEDSYVVVSPTRASRSREQSRARSAIARRDYPESEISRRRSRSISFRNSEVERHDCTERRHERPGAEAEICGRYLRQPVPASDYDGQSDIYSAHHESGSRSRARDTDRYSATYRERDEPYAPQVGYEPRKRDRSRRRRRDDDTEDGSYYSENVVKTTRETKYR